MPRSMPRCSESLSRGAALMRVVIGLVLLFVAFVVIRSCFPSREARMWRFVEDGRDALVENREEDFIAHFDPAVRYQGKSGVAEIRRDWKRWRATGIGQATLLTREATLDADGADVQLEVLFVAGMTPVSTTKVKLRLAEREGVFSVTSLSWE